MVQQLCHTGTRKGLCRAHAPLVPQAFSCTSSAHPAAGVCRRNPRSWCKPLIWLAALSAIPPRQLVSAAATPAAGAHPSSGWQHCPQSLLTSWCLPPQPPQLVHTPHLVGSIVCNPSSPAGACHESLSWCTTRSRCHNPTAADGHMCTHQLEKEQCLFSWCLP